MLKFAFPLILCIANNFGHNKFCDGQVWQRELLRSGTNPSICSLVLVAINVNRWLRWLQVWPAWTEYRCIITIPCIKFHSGVTRELIHFTQLLFSHVSYLLSNNRRAPISISQLSQWIRAWIYLCWIYDVWVTHLHRNKIKKQLMANSHFVRSCSHF